MLKYLGSCLAIVLFVIADSAAQNVGDIITAKEVERIEKVLASDDMMGRKAGTEGNNKAAKFIVDEFKKAGLKTWNTDANYLQSFTMVQSALLSVEASLDDVSVAASQIVAITSEPELKIDEKTGYNIEYIKADQDIRSSVQTIMSSAKNTVVFVENKFASMFPRLRGFNRPSFKSAKEPGANVVFILTDAQPKKFTINVKNDIKELPMSNIVGILPGKTKPNEYVIFSAHYDHLGIDKPQNGDSIYNGANDDAAGTTAVIMLANYFKKLANNARTLVFVTFTAEEMGGFGSQYFSKQFDPNSVIAMFNIEMIGTESKWGRNSAYITGFEKTDMGKLLQENLKGTAFTFYPDPYPDQQLFYRSDNATLASLGVPAHTISTSKMDSEKYYHTADDEVETLDLENMAAIIKAIAQSSTSIVDGKATPTRVKKEGI